MKKNEIVNDKVVWYDMMSKMVSTVVKDKDSMVTVVDDGDGG